MADNINNNIFKNGGFVLPQEKRIVKVDGSAVQKTLKKMTTPVVDFFTKEKEEAEEIVFKDYEQEIAKTEMKSAVIQKILNDSDPNARRSLNIVI